MTSLSPNTKTSTNSSNISSYFLAKTNSSKTIRESDSAKIRSSSPPNKKPKLSLKPAKAMLSENEDEEDNLNNLLLNYDISSSNTSNKTQKHQLPTFLFKVSSVKSNDIDNSIELGLKKLNKITEDDSSIQKCVLYDSW